MGNENKYKIEEIWDSVVYTRKWKSHQPELYYLISWNGYPEGENTWGPILTVKHFEKLIIIFDKNHFDKPTATITLIDIILLIVNQTAKALATKQKWGWLAKASSTNKPTKESWNFQISDLSWASFGFIPQSP